METMPSRSDRIDLTGSTEVRSNGLEATVASAWHRFPYSLVWTPIPILTWVLPFIGHIGITNSAGVIFDFAAPYTVNEDCMAFGWPTMYYQLDLSKVDSREAWDKAVYEANEIYKMRVHNLFCDNCHSHVARALNGMRYNGKSDWNMVSALLLFFRKGKYVSKRHCLVSWLPFLIISTVVIVITVLIVYR
ncbi:Transmembrane protein 222a [Fasciola hepatica]|uniref:Transmembrane protein 222a n=1 Tax=Fasciola hepatica TaxID=6192 RepID=A0A4E0RBV6_FASHE|nr:Transmembrane protein 222a [Fasciola hepatica]